MELFPGAFRGTPKSMRCSVRIHKQHLYCMDFEVSTYLTEAVRGEKVKARKTTMIKEIRKFPHVNSHSLPNGISP